MRRAGGGRASGGGRAVGGGGGRRASSPSLTSSLLAAASAARGQGGRAPASGAAHSIASRKDKRKAERSSKAAGRAAGYFAKRGGGSGARGGAYTGRADAASAAAAGDALDALMAGRKRQRMDASSVSRPKSASRASYAAPARSRTSSASRGKSSSNSSSSSGGGGEGHRRVTPDSDEDEELSEEYDVDNSSSVDSDDSDVEDDLPTANAKPMSLSRDTPDEDADLALIASLERKLGIRRGAGGDDPAAKLKLRKKAVAKLNREFAKEGFGEDFGDFLEDLDKVLVDDDAQPTSDARAHVHASAASQKRRAPADEDTEDGGSTNGADDNSDESQDEDEDEDEDAFSDEGYGDSEDGDEPPQLVPISDDDDQDGSSMEEEESVDEEDARTGRAAKRARLESAAMDTIDDTDASHSEDDEEVSSDFEEPDSTAGTSEKVEPIAAAATAGKYIPPHLRKRMEAGAAAEMAGTLGSAPEATDKTTRKYNMLYGWSAPEPEHKKKEEADPLATMSATEVAAARRRVQGLFNKLSETNVEPIANDLAQLYRTYSMAACNHLVLSHILDACAAETQVLRQLVMTYAALLSACHILIGPQVGSFMVERLVLQFADTAFLPRNASPSQEQLNASVDTLNAALAAEAAVPRTAGGSAKAELASLLGLGAGTRASSLAASSKLRNNILLLLSYLYMFHVVHPDLIGDLLKLLVARFHEVDSELLLLSLTHTGFQLRADDPVVLKDVLSSVLAKVKSLDDATAGSARVRVLSELILDVKNNRKRQSHEQAAERAAQLRKWLARLASKTSGVEGVDRRLRVTWADLMSISEKGRWWLVGASWVGRTAAGLTSSATATDEAAVDADGGILSAHTKHHDPTAAGAGRASEADAKLLALATKMRMNTAVRRSIFIAVMGADNAEAAMDRVLRLNLKGAAEREVIRVLMDCAGQEASYNPYYGALTVLLCTYNHHFKFTAQLAYWDAIKTFDDETTTPRRIYNLARLFAHLLCFGAVTLATLKVVDFTSMTPRMTLFVKAALIAVLLDVRTEEQVATIFTKLGNSSDRMMIRDGLSLFVHQHISGKALQQAAATRSAAGETVPQPAKLLSRLKVARRALDSVSAAATSGGTPADMLD